MNKMAQIKLLHHLLLWTGWPSQRTGNSERVNHRRVYTAELVSGPWWICTGSNDALMATKARPENKVIWSTIAVLEQPRFKREFEETRFRRKNAAIISASKIESYAKIVRLWA